MHLFQTKRILTSRAPLLWQDLKAQDSDSVKARKYGTVVAKVGTSQSKT